MRATHHAGASGAPPPSPPPTPTPLLLSVTDSPGWQRPLLRAFLHLHQTLCVFNPIGEICRHAEFNKSEINAIYCHMHQSRRSACRAALSVRAGWGMMVVGKIPGFASLILLQLQLLVLMSCGMGELWGTLPDWKHDDSIDQHF
jgi:hypothetical protein